MDAFVFRVVKGRQAKNLMKNLRRLRRSRLLQPVHERASQCIAREYSLRLKRSRVLASTKGADVFHESPDIVSAWVEGFTLSLDNPLVTVNPIKNAVLGQVFPESVFRLPTC